ncbi:MAG: hypothetical protein WD810_05755 [Solirubrobacterales bacterium]
MALLGLALCAGVAAVGAPAALAEAPRSPDRGLVLSHFELKGTHGYTVEAVEVREGDFPPMVTVEVHRKAMRASYEVPGDLGPGMHGVFGELGRVAVEFHRQKRSVDRPEKGCAWIAESGIFRGQFSFVGESGYTAAEATSARGEVLRLPNGICGFGDDRRSRRGFNPLQTTRLAARSRIPRGFVQFEASTLDFDPRDGFEALVRENVGAMAITRSTFAHGAADTFTFSPGNPPRRASVHPPPPFEGTARLRDRGSGPPTWTGSLSVSLPGSPQTPLTGPGFAARFCLNSSLLGGCKVALPPRTGARALRQINGSQSQLFADAKLSWSR